MKKTLLLCFSFLLMIVITGCSSKDEPKVEEVKAEDPIEVTPVEVELVYEVILIDSGDNPLEVVKEIKNNTGFGLVESKEIVDAAPATVASELNKEEAETLKTTLEAAGATIEVKEIEQELSETTATEVEQTEFEVVLIDAGAAKLNVVKEIKNNVGLDLASSKAIVDEAPATITTGLSKEEAENLKTILEAAGATVEIK